MNAGEKRPFPILRIYVLEQRVRRTDGSFVVAGTPKLGAFDAGTFYKYDGVTMTAIAKKLDARMNRWAPETAKKVERLVAEIIELADHDALDLVRSRQVEQEVLDIIDGRQAG